jgi:hypothetical protein
MLVVAGLGLWALKDNQSAKAQAMDDARAHREAKSEAESKAETAAQVDMEIENGAAPID